MQMSRVGSSGVTGLIEVFSLSVMLQTMIYVQEAAINPGTSFDINI